MPELAEVETVIRVLKSKLIGKKIEKVDVLYERMIEDIIEFKKIINKTIKDIKRHGKFIIFDLDGLYLVSHLRMEGKFFIRKINEENLKHDHVIIYFDSFKLVYNDVRKFGIMFTRTNDLYDKLPLSKLGLEPFFIDYKEFYRLIDKKRPIKELLLDQSIMSGLGNIYADEVLYKSQIMPNRLGCDVSLDEAKMIVDASIEILNEAINDGGTTIRSYTSSLGVKGNHQDKLLIHTLKKCPKGHDVLKMKVAGRTTYYCDKCER